MTGLCEGGNEPPGSLKAVSKESQRNSDSSAFPVHPEVCSVRFTADFLTPIRRSYRLDSLKTRKKWKRVCGGLFTQ
ncbi:hypothetical protein ANN_04051 [Periplaneta americana]|uniref:Uncharacterized protein n=1 Tax=Periplaneta americana TaxID=6978 RepID=A0ABQ8T7I1_PERAM|nr:hypothetical protein ANN_04051 [Periplaneta americana]